MLAILLVLALVSCGSKDDGGTNNTNTDTATNTDTSTNTGVAPNPTCKHPEFTDWETVREPTCTTRGFYRRSCVECGQLSSKTTDALGHIEVVDPAVEPTCISLGYTEGKHCTRCGFKTVAQQEIKDANAHKYSECVSVSTTPSLTSAGSATFKCSLCDKTGTVNLPKLTSEKLTKADIYSITTNNPYNPAVDNAWKVVDGNKNTAGIYNTGDDWFGNVGDKLIITLGQEMVLTDLTLYLAGNYTFATVRVKNITGGTTKTVSNINANGSAYGGEGQKVTVISGQKITAYTIEIEITDNKSSYMNYKVAEIEISAAKPDLRLPHTHHYREFVKDTKPATCTKKGMAEYQCFCGKTKEYPTNVIDHSYETLSNLKEATCTEDGLATYSCSCGLTQEKTIKAKGHIYAKLVNYISEPTISSSGSATMKCIGCELTQTKTLSALPLEDVNYLRVDSIQNGKVTLKFNIYGSQVAYEVRYSENEITEANFSSATKLNATKSGSKEISLEFALDASLTKGYYVAVRAVSGSNYGKISTVRVGGDLQLPIDYNSANVYHGEVLNSFASLFDEQNSTAPSTALEQIFRDSSDTILYGSNLSPIIDLEYMHYVSRARIYYGTAGYTVKVRWSDTPLDFMSSDSIWDGFYTFTSQVGWNDIAINKSARYIQVIFKDGQAPNEITLYGYQCGAGDEISQTVRDLPTLNEMMGMCGFVAAGAGNTPVDSVKCTTVLREYHNFGWSYSRYNYPNQAMFFTSGNMGNFDERYKEYYEAGINVIPCFQWALTNDYSVSHKVDNEKLPVKQNNKLVQTTFWEKFDPHTYFVYADGMFSFAARYGSNKSTALLNTVSPHVSETKQAVGLGYIKWIELGNEPEGSWNGIHNYYSAYQLAALTSAGYDGHGRTLRTPVSTGYHLGAKNADPNMMVAMAGVSGISNEYITALCYWMKANRTDGKVALDAFNVHHYMSKQIEIEGNKLYVGMSPEEANLVETLSQLVGIRNKYYTDKEVWITEFGWDTNQSYATVNSSHAYAEYTGRQVQAMWLTRAYLLLSASGIDKATMYMCEDVGTVENEAVGKFATSGVIGFEYDSSGNVVEVKKDSYFYLYTLKNTLGDYTFKRQIEAYDENVLIYEFENAKGQITYAVWCKTSDGTKSLDYQLRIDGNSATLVEAVYGDIDGVQSDLVADSLGYVSIDVSENPVYVVVK